jgi:ABC-2 type transport system ATP-binding protein
MSTIEIERASKWFGHVVAVNDVTMTIAPGITGLLGPNGAGKTTLLNMVAGFAAPSSGGVTLGGKPTWRNEEIYSTIGMVPEQEAMYDFLTGAKFVLANAKLHGLADPGAAAARAVDIVEMADAADRPIATYSKGMRQRMKMAAALVHDPSVLLLDEPFNGMDPRQRLHLMELLRRMGSEGRTVVFSSHILEEVEQLATHIQVMVAGRHAASGDYRAIRRLMTDRPHRYRLRSDDDRALAAALVAEGAVGAVQIDEDEALHVQTSDFGRFTVQLPRVAREHKIRLYDVSPADESLESVFGYLVRS